MGLKSPRAITMKTNHIYIFFLFFFPFSESLLNKKPLPVLLVYVQFYYKVHVLENGGKTFLAIDDFSFQSRGFQCLLRGLRLWLSECDQWSDGQQSACMNSSGSLCTGALELQPHSRSYTFNLTHADKWLSSPAVRGD